MNRPDQYALRGSVGHIAQNSEDVEGIVLCHFDVINSPCTAISGPDLASKGSVKVGKFGIFVWGAS